jgi:hypothetical protein
VDSDDGSAESKPSKRPTNLLDPNEAMNLHKKAHQHMKETQANTGRSMVHKRVSVDKRTKEF